MYRSQRARGASLLRLPKLRMNPGGSVARKSWLNLDEGRQKGISSPSEHHQLRPCPYHITKTQRALLGLNNIGPYANTSACSKYAKPCRVVYV